ncbi:MAG: ANTAR domain-containing response regulator [Thermodesulfobacteriota bacterium]
MGKKLKTADLKETALKVLIAEDNPTSRRCLKNQLEALGYNVLGVAKTGPEVVEMAAKLKPSFIVMDIAMPGMDGITAAKKITAKDTLPIIIVTGHSSEELAEGAIEAGVFAYLVKPITKKELLPAIKLAFARYSEFRDLKDEMQGLNEALETRKLVERAKGILMKRCAVSENEAFKLLQSYSQKENKKLKDIAEMIISASTII